MQIYTDGSCHSELKLGAWAAVILDGKAVIQLLGEEAATTHNAMEIVGVLKAIDYILQHKMAFTKLEIITDSQYVVHILARKDKLKQANFLTKKHQPIRNVALVKQLIQRIETLPLTFIKTKAHQKKGDDINYNRVVDKAARAAVRRRVALRIIKSTT